MAEQPITTAASMLPPQSAFSVHFVDDGREGYEIQLENNDGLDDETLIDLLEQALRRLEGTSTNRARGMW